MEESEVNYQIVPCDYHTRCEFYNPVNPLCNTKKFEDCATFQQKRKVLERTLANIFQGH